MVVCTGGKMLAKLLMMMIHKLTYNNGIKINILLDISNKNKILELVNMLILEDPLTYLYIIQANVESIQREH